MNNRYIFFLILVTTFSFSKPVVYSQIDTNKSAIQVAVVKYLKSLKPLDTYNKRYDTYIEKRKHYVYYIVNIEKKDKKSVIKDVRKRIKNAFFINPKVIQEDIRKTPKITITQVEKQINTQPNIQKSGKNIYQTPLYKKALYFYKQRDFQKSYKLFNQLFYDNMGDILINYYLGRSAYEIKEYEFAISAYDRILIAEPQNTRVRLELAQTYLQMQLYPQALKEFSTTLDEKMPLQVKKRVLDNIELIKQKQKKHFFNVTALLGIIYDSNINNSPKARNFDVYNPTLDTNVTLSNSGEELSATIFQLAGIFSHKYKMSEKVSLESSLTLMNLKYNNYKDKEVHFIGGSFTPTYYGDDYKLGISSSFEKVYLGHHPHQFNFYIIPNYTKVLTQNILYNTALKAGRINYHDTPLRDSKLLEWQNSFKYLTKEYGMFTFLVNVGREFEINSTRTDVAYDFYTLGVENNYNFTGDLSLQSLVTFDYEHYEDSDINFLSRRKDKQGDFSLNLTKTIDKNSAFVIGASYSQKTSNQESFPFSKYTCKINYIKGF